MLVCKNCGSENVTTLAWVYVNTNEYDCDGPDDFYCEDCGSKDGVRKETPEKHRSELKQSIT